MMRKICETREFLVWPKNDETVKAVKWSKPQNDNAECLMSENKTSTRHTRRHKTTDACF